MMIRLDEIPDSANSQKYPITEICYSEYLDRYVGYIYINNAAITLQLGYKGHA